jgi:hypothetical protein
VTELTIARRECRVRADGAPAIGGAEKLIVTNGRFNAAGRDCFIGGRAIEIGGGQKVEVRCESPEAAVFRGSQMRSCVRSRTRPHSSERDGTRARSSRTRTLSETTPERAPRTHSERMQ